MGKLIRFVRTGQDTAGYSKPGRSTSPTSPIGAPRTAVGRFAANLVGLALVIGALVVAAPPASAASGDNGHIKSGANHRSCSDSRCAAERYVPADSWVQVWCWRDGGQSANSSRWFRVRYAGADAWVHSSTMDRQPSVPYCSEFRPGETLFSGQSIWSSNGSYRLIMQSDGNLVAYGPSGAMWAARSGGHSGARAVMQRDGNLVVYTSSNAAAWSSGTPGNSGAYLSVQSDSNLVIHKSGTALFATNWYRQHGQSRGHNGASDRTQCTYLAYERFRSDTGTYPALAGNAHNWDDSARAAGWRVQSVPATHSIVVFESTSTNAAGHVAYVDEVQLRSDGLWIRIHERNWNFRGSDRTRWLKHHSGLDYIPARQL